MKVLILVFFVFSIVGTWAHASTDIDSAVTRMLNEVDSEFFESDVETEDEPIAKIDNYYEENPQTQLDIDKTGQIQVRKKKRKLAKKSVMRKLQKTGSAEMEFTYSTPTWNIESVADGEEFYITGMTDRARNVLEGFSRLTKQQCIVKGQFKDGGVYITSLTQCKRLSVADASDLF